MITIAVERTAPVTPRSLIDRIWSGVEWRLARMGVKALAVDYDDGLHQSVQVCVGSRSGHLPMSVMRYSRKHVPDQLFLLPPPERRGETNRSLGSPSRCRRRMPPSAGAHDGTGAPFGETDSVFKIRETAHGEMLRQHLGLTLDVVAEGLG